MPRVPSRLCFALPLAFLIAAANLQGQTKWTEIRTPHFTVVTNASAKDGRDVARQFERFRAVFERLTEGGIAKTERPVDVLALRDEASMRAMAPAFWEGRNQSHPAGLFVRGADRLHVALRLDVGRDYAAAAAELGYTVNPYHVVFHEYVHTLLQNNDRLPLWLNEAAAEFYANSIIESERVLLGKPNADNLYYLQNATLLPLDRLLQVTRGSREYRDADRTPLFYAQSWALFHFLRVGQQGANRAKLTAYRSAVEAGADSLTAARSAFGDLGEFQGALSLYIRNRAFYQEIMPGRTVVDESGWTTRVLTVQEAALARARFHAQMQRPAEAEALLAEASGGGTESAPILEVRALLQRQAGNDGEAQASYRRALELGSTSALTHLEAARVSILGQTEVTSLQEAQRLVEKAITLDTSFAPAYALLGEILLARDVEATRAFAMGMRAIELTPGDVHGYLVAGRAALRLDRIGDAVTLATRAMSVCKSDEERDRVAPLLTEATRRAK